MKVLVTGGIGNVGTQVIARLSGHGHEVTVIGRRPGMQAPGATYRQCDITDIDALVATTGGMDAVVHLAAYGNPGMGTPDVIFRVNCQGTMNVYEAAARCGIRRVVTASSINALGYGFGVREWDIRYFPIDEDHPTFTTDAYSFSKNHRRGDRPVLVAAGGHFRRLPAPARGRHAAGKRRGEHQEHGRAACAQSSRP